VELHAFAQAEDVRPGIRVSPALREGGRQDIPLHVDVDERVEEGALDAPSGKAGVERGIGGLVVRPSPRR
jgi:hypothetical protein